MSEDERSHTMNHRKFPNILAVIALASAGLMTALAHASDEAADALIKRQSNEVLDTIKSDPLIQAGDASRIIALVDARVMPNVNFKRMTASTVGPSWRQANPEQQRRLQEEFKTLMVRTYAGAVVQAIDLSIHVKPLRSSPGDQEVVVRTQAIGRGDPVQIDYRLDARRWRWMEDRQSECHGCLAGGDVSQPVFPRDQCQRHRWIDLCLERTQQSQRQKGMKSDLSSIRNLVRPPS